MAKKNISQIPGSNGRIDQDEVEARLQRQAQRKSAVSGVPFETELALLRLEFSAITQPE